ncbi:MAG: orotidine 5'-phosphate decarboxylase / HUMPS family protein, partial [Candidatus Nanohaloarchaea archaeon]
LKRVAGRTDLSLAVAGGLDAGTVGTVAEHGASVAIVGSAITTADDPGAAARKIRDAMEG